MECLWTLPSGEKWGWQAKFVFDIRGALRQLRESFERAIDVHPELSRFIACLPFTLSAARGPRGGQSQVDKFEAFRRRAEHDASVIGTTVRVELWDESALSEHLLAIDAEGGRRRYWFDASALSHCWFREHLDQARVLAGPRYTPGMHHGHSLDEVFAALGGLDEWGERVEEWTTKLAEARAQWSRSLASSPDPAVPPFPDAIRPAGSILMRALESVSDTLRVVGGVEDALLLELVNEAHLATERCVSDLETKLDENHHKGASHSAQFRQQSAELMVSFPAAHLDRGREILALLDDFGTWLGSAAPRAARKACLLVTGPAGIGKTHGVCDAANSRHQRNLPSVVLFGHRLRAGAPLWSQIRDQLGLGTGGWTKRALFDALDTAGQTAGKPLIVFVDALNESEPRSLWSDELPLLVSEVRARPHLRLCVTCRSAYLDQVLPSDCALPRFEHQGFAGQEFDACSAFFEHHGLEPPVGPLLHPEFANPLFLKLVCQAMVARGERRLPVGWTGIQQVLKTLLAIRDEELAKRHPGIDSHVASRAMVAFASELDQRRVRHLSLSDADAVLSNVLPESRRAEVPLLDTLEGADLLIRVPGLPKAHSFAPSEDHISIAFDRLRDHLLAHAAAESSPTDEGLSDAVRVRIAAAAEDPGVAAALSLLVPEVHRAELLDLIDDDERRAWVLGPWLDALSWRACESITERTAELLWQGLRSTDHVESALDALVSLAVRPGHALDAHWLHHTLARLPMPDRDAVWCRYLHDAFDRQDGSASSPVVRLLQSAWSEGVDGVSRDVLYGWLTALSWFFAAADRRVRDRATKAAVRISEARPSIWIDLLNSFLDVDDDYVVERAVAAAYGALLRSRDETALRGTAAVLARRLFADGARHRPNALLRDHARCIGELAHQCNALPPELELQTFLPPYDSDWPLAVPTEADLEKYGSRESRQRHPRLLESCTDTHMGDFAIYTVARALSGYTHGLPLDGARRWIFRHVLDMGYSPERFAVYDYEMLRVYGGGRGRPTWADRIGKKYQLIALAQLVGHVRDHIPWRGADWDSPTLEDALQGERLRDIDPSLLARDAEPDTTDAWWVATRPDFEATANTGNVDWVGRDDFPDPKVLLQPVSDPKRPDQKWRLLNGLFRWYDRNDSDWDTPRREVWIWLHGYLLPRRFQRRCWERLRRADFWGRWMPAGWEDESCGFVGEYPCGTVFRQRRESDDYRDPKMPFPLEPVCNIINSSFEEDAWQRGVIHVHLPSREFVRWTGTRWDGVASFIDPESRALFTDPALASPGPGCLLADDARLRSTLKEHDQIIVWSYMAERRIVSSSFRRDYYAGSKHISRALWLDGTKVRASRRPVGEHALPGGSVVRLS